MVIDWPTLTERALRAGIDLPPVPTPKGDYKPAVLHGGLIYTSGMGPMLHGERRHSGYVGSDVSVEQARHAAGIAAVNALMAAVSVAGGVQHVEQLVKVTGYVRSAPGFTEQAAVVDGASQALLALLGPAGTHARTAVGVAELPFGISVEVELVAAHRP